MKDKQQLTLRRLKPEKRSEIVTATNTAAKLLSLTSKRQGGIWVNLVVGYTQQPYIKRHRRYDELKLTAQRISEKTGVEASEVEEELFLALRRYCWQDVFYLCG